jgi:signal transduction histidine kinase
MTPQTALLISTETDFSAALAARWEQERARPQMAALRPESFLAAQVPCDLVVVGPLFAALRSAVLRHAVAAARPVICLVEEEEVRALRPLHPGVLFLCRREGWAELAVHVAAHLLRAAQSGRAAAPTALSPRHAALGRCLLEVRHDFNNALTSALGNAELLLLEPAALPRSMRDQVEVVHTMILRMRAILQRLATVDMEMRLAEGQATPPFPAAAARVHPEPAAV